MLITGQDRGGSSHLHSWLAGISLPFLPVAVYEHFLLRLTSNGLLVSFHETTLEAAKEILQQYFRGLIQFREVLSMWRVNQKGCKGREAVVAYFIAYVGVCYT
jgi:hypothetical protein